MKKLIFVCLSLIFLLLIGCASGEQTASKIDRNASYVVTDDKNRTIKIEKKPKRIVSTTYGTDEILVELIPLDNIKAFSKWAGDNEITFISDEQARQVGNKVGENTEAIIALQPDLVFASVATSESLIKSLEEMGIPVYIAGSPKTVAEMRKKVLGVAKAVDEEEKGIQLIDKMDKQMSKLNNRLKGVDEDKKKIAMAFAFVGAIGRKDHLLDDIFKYAKVRNGSAEAGLDQGNNTLSKEKIIETDPDVFLLPTWNFDPNSNAQTYAKQITDDPAFANIKAIKNNHIEFVSDRYRYVASQHIVESIEEIAKAVYPELFLEEE